MHSERTRGKTNQLIYESDNGHAHEYDVIRLIVRHHLSPTSNTHTGNRQRTEGA